MKWSRGTIKWIVENRAYYSARVNNKVSSSKIIAAQKGRSIQRYAQSPVWKMLRMSGIVTEGAHEPIVSKEHWMQANDAGKAHSLTSVHKAGYNSQYLLIGLVQSQSKKPCQNRLW